MEDAKAAGGNGSGRLRGIDAPSCCLTADQLYILIFNEVVERADGIGAAALHRPARHLEACLPSQASAP